MSLSASGMRAFLAQSQQTLEDLFPGIVQINGGAPLEVAITRGGASAALQLGYNNPSQELVFRLSHTATEDIPQDHQRVLYDGVTYRITSIVTRPHETAYHITCTPESDLS